MEAGGGWGGMVNWGWMGASLWAVGCVGGERGVWGRRNGREREGEERKEGGVCMTFKCRGEMIR